MDRRLGATGRPPPRGAVRSPARASAACLLPTRLTATVQPLLTTRRSSKGAHKKTALDEKSQPEQPGHQVVGQRVGRRMWCSANIYHCYLYSPAGTDLPSVYPSARCSPAADCLTVTHRAYGWTWTAVLYCSAASCLPPLRFRERACACLCLCGAPEPIPPPPRASSFLSTAPNHASLRIKLKSTQKSRSPSEPNPSAESCTSSYRETRRPRRTSSPAEPQKRPGQSSDFGMQLSFQRVLPVCPFGPDYL